MVASPVLLPGVACKYPLLQVRWRQRASPNPEAQVPPTAVPIVPMIQQDLRVASRAQQADSKSMEMRVRLAALAGGDSGVNKPGTQYGAVRGAVAPLVCWRCDQGRMSERRGASGFKPKLQRVFRCHDSWSFAWDQTARQPGHEFSFEVASASCSIRQWATFLLASPHIWAESGISVRQPEPQLVAS